MTFTESEKNDLFIRLSESNKKLVPNKNTKFLIFNLPSVITCPSATDACRFYCYARKAEKQYKKTCLPSRMRHLEESKTSNFVERMIYSINAYINKPSYKTAKKIVVRIHESGDFYNMQYLLKWYEIANHFKNDKRLIFMAYTKSVKFIDDISILYLCDIPKNMVVRYSVWNDTKADQIALAKKYSLPIYTAVDKFTNEIKSQNKCLCVDCATCGKCWTRTKGIYCEIH